MQTNKFKAKFESYFVISEMRHNLLVNKNNDSL